MGLFESVWFCPNCNYQNIGSGNKCENCGESFDDDVWVDGYDEIISEYDEYDEDDETAF